jgi:long-subunit fatty acid transport protein
MNQGRKNINCIDSSLCNSLMYVKAIIILTFLSIGEVVGQSKTGTTIGQFTLIDPSSKISAMGSAGATSTDEVMATYYNPGALGALQRSDIQFSYNSWLAGISLNYAMVSIKILDNASALVTMTQLASGDIDVTTVDQPLGTGEKYTVTDLELGIGFGIKMTEKFSFGVQVNYVSERIWHSSIAVFGINLGTLYQLSPDGLKIGASLINFGTTDHFTGTDLKIRYDLDPTRYGDNSSIPSEISTDYYALPMVFRVGLGYPVTIDGSNVVNLGVDALHPSDNAESVNVGAEWVFNKFLAARIGYQSLFLQDSEVGLTAGGGVMIEGDGYDLHFDYAWAANGRLGNVQRITLGIGL